MGLENQRDFGTAVTLDQLRLFVTVVEQGSFTGAGRHLRRAQSAVSYGIANLEEQLGVALFDRSGRRPELTAVGRSLLRDARQVLGRVGRLQQRAASAVAGLESDLAVAFDTLVPGALLAEACRAFQVEFPTVSLRLYSEVLDGVTSLVRDGTCQLGLGAQVGDESGELRWRFLTHVPLVAVAAADHPLAALRGPIATSVAAEHVQIVISKRARRDGVDFSVLSAQTWNVVDAQTKLELIRAGLGWGNLPVDRVRADLDAGRLRRLVLEAWGDAPVMVPMCGIVRDDAQLGPAARWLLDALTEIFAAAPPA